MIGFEWCVVEWFRIPNKETNEKFDKDLVEEGFHFASVKFDGDGEGGREAIGMGKSSINI